MKCSDDGEPLGSGGIRILNAIDHSNLKKVTVTVIRYFGRTKLGGRLFGKAYFKIADLMIEKAKRINYHSFSK